MLMFMEIRLSFAKMSETRQKEMDSHQTVNFCDVCLELRIKGHLVQYRNILFFVRLIRL